jgi:Fic family protein
MDDSATSQSGHAWAHITDLSKEDLAARNEELPVLSEVWHEEYEKLDSKDAVERFNERLRREWAIETGIIERLYSLDRGITELLIERGIDESLIPSDASDQPPEIVARLIKDQEAAVEFVFDVVANRRGLTVSFIKELHALMTRHQSTTMAIDQFGREIELPLEKGTFKRWPNNPRRADGTTHEYCPPEHVEAEMQRLMEMHYQHIGAGVPADVEAAWLHHRFTQIHPFQDGNGRIARAIASLVLIQEHWFPLVITRDDRVEYLDALEEADRNGLASLIKLFAKRQKRAFVASLGIAREITRDGDRIDQQLAAISEMFARRDKALRIELDRAKVIARQMWRRANDRFEGLAHQVELSMSSQYTNRRAFVDSASDHDLERSKWYRWQIVQAAKDLGYFAALHDFCCWVKMGIDTENGRSELLLSLHGIGQDYQGVIGGSLSFYRRQESPEGERQVVDHETLSDEVFQINYKDSEEAVEVRFDRWLDEGLVRGLDAWRRGE